MGTGRSTTAGAVWAALAATSYSLSSIVGKDLLGALGVGSLLLWRFGLASVVLLVILKVWQRRGGPDPFALPRWRALLIGVLFGLMTSIGFVALHYLDVSVYIVLVYLYPVMVVVASSLLGHHRASGLTWVALVVVMVGVVLTVPQLFGGVGKVSMLGVALTVLQAAAMASFMVVSGRLMPKHVDGVVQAFWNVLGGALVMVPIAAVTGFVMPSGGRLVAEVLLFALVPTVLANVCFFAAMRRVAPGVVAMIMTLEVALAILWSVLLLDERMSAVKLIGAAVVVVGVLIAQRAARAVGDDPTGEMALGV